MDENHDNLINEIDRLSKCSYSGYEEDKPEKLLDWYVKKFELLYRAIERKDLLIYRGEIYRCDLGENVGCEESKLRPCVIIQNQKGNENAPTTIVAPITNSSIRLPVAVPLDRGESSPITGTIDLGQIRVISKGRIYGKIDKLRTGEENSLNKALLKSVGLFKYVIENEEKSQKIRTLSNELRSVKDTLKQIKTILKIENDESILEEIQNLKK